MTDSGDAGVPAAEGRHRADERAEPEALGPGPAGPHHPPDKPPRRRFSWRTPVAALLIFVGCVLAPISVVAVWTANQVSDTSRYVANVAPLIKDPAIQNALTAHEVVIDSSEPQIPVGIDGESVLMPTPVRCTIHPLALRVRVPRNRPGVPEPRPQLDWARLRRLAFTSGRATGYS